MFFCVCVQKTITQKGDKATRIEKKNKMVFFSPSFYFVEEEQALYLSHSGEIYFSHLF